MALFYLQFINGTIIGKILLLVAGLFCFSRIFGSCSSFGNCKIKANGANTNAGWKYEMMAEKANKEAKDALCKTCSKPAMEDILECLWCEGFQHRECTKIVLLCVMLYPALLTILYFLLFLFTTTSSCIEILRHLVKCGL